MPQINGIALSSSHVWLSGELEKLPKPLLDGGVDVDIIFSYAGCMTVYELEDDDPANILRRPIRGFHIGIGSVGVPCSNAFCVDYWYAHNEEPPAGHTGRRPPGFRPPRPPSAPPTDS